MYIKNKNKPFKQKTHEKIYETLANAIAINSICDNQY